MKNSTILIVDDDHDLLTALKILLRPKMKQVITEHNPENILSLLQRHDVDIVLLDMNFKSAIHTGNEGLYWLATIKNKFPNIQVIMITAYGAIDLAVRSLKQGAADFVVKPWENDQLVDVIRHTSEETSKPKTKKTETKLASSNTLLIGDSPVMQELKYKISKIAPTDANILILGENGTGKDLIAQEIHVQSKRKDRDFVKVDVGALTETLFESELFGYKKGAFTDAREDRKGRFEHAHQGTLFLDEIGNISLHQQAKLLSVLQNRQVAPLGSSQPISVDIRLLSATNVPLRALADENRFRKDLIYRINTVEIQVPPLRERGDDVLVLAAHFLRFYAAKYHKALERFSDAALDKLKAYHFPGNVRELQYSIERAVIMSEGDHLQAQDLLFSPIEDTTEGQLSSAQQPRNLEEMERKAIQHAIERYNGNISKAARELGLTRAALYRRMEKYGI